MPRRTLACGALIGAVQLLVACSLSQDDPSTIHDLRILAISATPPELFYRVHGVPLEHQCQPDLSGIQTSGEIGLQALVVDPLGRNLDWTWTFCPMDMSSSERNPTATNRCPTDPAYLLAQGSGPASTIATQWSLAQTAFAEIAAQQSCRPPQTCAPTPLLTALGQDPLGLCRFGIWLQIGLEVDAPGGEQIFASKLLVLTPVPDDYPTDPAVCPQGPDGGPPAHTNPAWVGLSLNGIPLLDGGTGSDGGDGGINQVLGIGYYDIRPLPPDGGAQDYCVPDFSGGWRRLTETWLFSLITTGGSFSREQVGGAGGAAGTGIGASQPGPSTDLTVKWTVPAGGGPTTFYEVTRDGRGGTSWSTWQLDVVTP
jgi:hypothetical protein